MEAQAQIDTSALNADWQRFANTLGYNELAKLEQAGGQYRGEVPGARIVDGTLEANLSASGLTLQSQDASDHFVTYDAAHSPAVASTFVRAITPRGRPGRAIPVP